MRDEGRGRFLLFAAAVMAATGAFAFQPIPKEGAKALGVTRGKPFSAGVVFINGKYIEPPYVVERWGTGIRINKEPVTGQVIDWNEFLKTQEGVKVEKRTETVPAAPVVQQAAPAVEDVDSSSLDDLFDDDPKPVKRRTIRPPVRRRCLVRPCHGPPFPMYWTESSRPMTLQRLWSGGSMKRGRRSIESCVRAASSALEMPIRV